MCGVGQGGGQGLGDGERLREGGGEGMAEGGAPEEGGRAIAGKASAERAKRVEEEEGREVLEAAPGCAEHHSGVDRRGYGRMLDGLVILLTILYCVWVGLTRCYPN